MFIGHLDICFCERLLKFFLWFVLVDYELIFILDCFFLWSSVALKLYYRGFCGYSTLAFLLGFCVSFGLGFQLVWIVEIWTSSLEETHAQCINFSEREFFGPSSKDWGRQHISLLLLWDSVQRFSRLVLSIRTFSDD